MLEVAKQCFYPFMAKEKYCQRNLFEIFSGYLVKNFIIPLSFIMAKIMNLGIL